MSQATAEEGYKCLLSLLLTHDGDFVKLLPVKKGRLSSEAKRLRHNEVERRRKASMDPDLWKERHAAAMSRYYKKAGRCQKKDHSKCAHS